MKEYFLLHPTTGKRLETVPISPYFTVPACIIRQERKHWSLRAMRPSDIALYTTMLFKASQARRNSFEARLALLGRMSDLSASAVSSAMRSLQAKRLVVADGNQISLCDPLTGEPVVVSVDGANDPANYYTTEGQRIDFNIDNPDALVKWIEDSLPKGEHAVPESNGEYKIKCPYHVDHNPSLNFNTSKGIFYCFGCDAKGTIRQLVTKLTGKTEAETLRLYSRAIGVDNAVFNPPDSSAEGIYSYTDYGGNVLYQVLRYPGKRFSQRKFTPQGWEYNLKGVKRTLYNLKEIPGAGRLIITEGEKDADRLNGLALTDVMGGRVVATTSGGADSWDDRFADLLRHPSASVPMQILTQIPEIVSECIVIMPDSDAPGREYESKVIASLQNRGILFCVVRFTGFKDVSEYLDAGYTNEQLAQLISAELAKVGQERVVTDAAAALREEIQI